MSIPAAGNDVGVGEVGQNIAVAWLTMAAGAAQVVPAQLGTGGDKVIAAGQPDCVVYDCGGSLLPVGPGVLGLEWVTP
nr:hypothetical protein [Mycobacterium sp. MAC_011194_8550]